MDNADRKKGGITLPKLQTYIVSTLNVKLTPGETAELFRQIDTENQGIITQTSLAKFLKKNTHDLLAGGEFDDSYPIVDVAGKKKKKIIINKSDAGANVVVQKNWESKEQHVRFLIICCNLIFSDFSST